MKRNTLAAIAVFSAAALYTSGVFAQMVTTSTPFNRVGDSFHENIGSSWSLRGNNWNMSFGGGNANPGASQFGNNGANGGLRGGVGFVGNGFSGNIWGQMSQGSSRSLVSQTPSVTTFNGAPGVVSDTQQSPFVIGMTPVVGYWDGHNRMVDPTGGAFSGNMNREIPNHAVSSALDRVRAAENSPQASLDSNFLKRAAVGSDRLTRTVPEDISAPEPVLEEDASSAAVAVGSVAQMKRLYEQETLEPLREKTQINIDKARAAAEQGRISAAKSYYKTALKYADSEMKPIIIKEYNALIK